MSGVIDGQSVSASVTNLGTISILKDFLGAGFLNEQSATISNGQASPTAVNGLAFNSAMFSSVIVFVEIRRSTASGEVVGSGFLYLVYRSAASSWDISSQIPGDDHGVTFSITSVGQVQYVSTTLAGSGYVGAVKFKAMTFNQ